MKKLIKTQKFSTAAVFIAIGFATMLGYQNCGGAGFMAASGQIAPQLNLKDDLVLSELALMPENPMATARSAFIAQQARTTVEIELEAEEDLSDEN